MLSRHLREGVPAERLPTTKAGTWWAWSRVSQKRQCCWSGIRKEKATGNEGLVQEVNRLECMWPRGLKYPGSYCEFEDSLVYNVSPGQHGETLSRRGKKYDLGKSRWQQKVRERAQKSCDGLRLILEKNGRKQYSRKHEAWARYGSVCLTSQLLWDWGNKTLGLGSSIKWDLSSKKEKKITFKGDCPLKT